MCVNVYIYIHVCVCVCIIICMYVCVYIYIYIYIYIYFGRRPKETRCETMENERTGKRGMGINYKGSQGQTKRAVVL